MCGEEAWIEEIRVEGRVSSARYNYIGEVTLLTLRLSASYASCKVQSASELLIQTICFYRRAKSINSTEKRAPDESYSGALIVMAFGLRLEKMTSSYLPLNAPGT